MIDICISCFVLNNIFIRCDNWICGFVVLKISFWFLFNINSLFMLEILMCVLDNL